MKRPSKIKVVRAKKAWFLLPSFAAITLFGTVYCKRKSDISSINSTEEVDGRMKSHETIHVRQAESVRNSWLCFYFLYLCQWLYNLPLLFVNVHAPYKFIPFELEAFHNQDDWDYCKGKCVEWKKFRKIKMSQRIRLAKQYYKNKVYFTQFIEDYVMPVTFSNLF